MGKQGALPSAGPGVRCIDTAFPELALGTRARGCVRGWSRRHRQRSRGKCPGARRPPPRGPQAHPAAGCGGRWGGVDGRWHKRATPAAGTPRRGRQDTAAALAGRVPSGDGGQRGLDARTRPALLPGGPARAEVDGTCPLAAQSWAATAPAPEGNEAGPGRHRRCPWRRLVVEGPGQTPRLAADEGTGQGQRLRRGPAELRDVTPYGLHLWGSRCNESQLRFKINHV